MTVEVRRASGALLWRANVARSFWARLRGLIGRPAPAEGEGLLLPGTNSVHMLFMGYPIDVVFLGRAGADGSQQVLALRHGLRPWTGVVWWVRGAKAALELRAGAVAETALDVGDRLNVTEVSANQ